MQLHTGRVFVRNLTVAQAFYEQTLELPLQAGRAEDGFCVFGAGPCQLVIEPVTVPSLRVSSSEKEVDQSRPI